MSDLLFRIDQRIDELATDLDRLEAQGDIHQLSVDTVQRLMALAVHFYASRVRNREHPADPIPAALPPDSNVTPTEVVIAVEQLLEAGEVDIFELEMWRVLGRG